jgi:hypothetical protein
VKHSHSLYFIFSCIWTRCCLLSSPTTTLPTTALLPRVFTPSSRFSALASSTGSTLSDTTQSGSPKLRVCCKNPYVTYNYFKCVLIDDVKLINNIN